MNYELKNKIQITKEFLNDLEMKSWQEIEHLQGQIANLAEGPATAALQKLLKNLLTSYYVFAGSLENLEGELEVAPIPVKKPIEVVPEIPEDILTVDEVEIPKSVTQFNNDVINTDEGNEPFEYFVDFDEPIGNPLTDEDLYN